MRVPDYGKGDWAVKCAKNRDLPTIEQIGVRGDTLHLALSIQADSIKLFGQGHTTLLRALHTREASYVLGAKEPYARFTAYFPEGEVIYTNPFARYDASRHTSPYVEPTHTVNWPMSILFNLLLLLLAIGVSFLFYKTVIRWQLP